MSTIYTLAIECVAGVHLRKEFGFVVEIRSDATLNDLAMTILDIIQFDGDHLSEFYLAKDRHARERIQLAEDSPWEDDAMDDVRLCDIFPLARKQLLYYAYDPGSNWCFEIEMKVPETMATPRRKYPRVVDRHGRRPPEYVC